MIDELSKLAEIELGQIVDQTDRYFSFSESADYLQLLLETVQDSINNQKYFAELPENIRQTIQTKLHELLNVLSDIRTNRGNRDWMTSNYTNMNDRIKQSYNELYDSFIRGVREYINSNSLATTKKAAQDELDRAKQATDDEIAKLKQATQEARKTSGATKSTLKLAQEATSEISAGTLSEFFEDEVCKTKTDRPDIRAKKWWLRWTIVRSFWRKWVSSRGYDVSAGRWLLLTLIAITATSIIAYRELHGIDYATITVNIVLAKALLLLAPAYAIRFCVRNYNANKHLATVNKQRGVVMKTVLALLIRPGITEKTRDKVLIAAVTQVFAVSETGYVTQKDGASGGDAVLDLSSITDIAKR